MANRSVRTVADGHESVGNLVSLAVSDITQLVRYEVDLAKIELKSDVRRLGVGAVLLGMAAFVGCLCLILLCFAYAYGLQDGTGWPLWGCFLVVFGTCVLLALLAGLVGIAFFKRLSKLNKTRTTVSDDLAMIRKEDTEPTVTSAGTR